MLSFLPFVEKDNVTLNLLDSELLLFILHLRDPSVIVQRQILCRNSPDAVLGTTQYFRVTAVSGRLADVWRADVNLLFMSIPREGIHFY